MTSQVLSNIFSNASQPQLTRQKNIFPPLLQRQDSGTPSTSLPSTRDRSKSSTVFWMDLKVSWLQINGQKSQSAHMPLHWEISRIWLQKGCLKKMAAEDAPQAISSQVETWQCECDRRCYHCKTRFSSLPSKAVLDLKWRKRFGCGQHQALLSSSERWRQICSIFF